MVRLSALLLVGAAHLAAQERAERDAALSDVSQKVIYQDGKIARLEVSARIAVRVPGIYGLTVELTAANGHSLTGRAREHLESGPQSLVAVFHSFDIRNVIAVDGPYEISDIRLFSEPRTGPSVLVASQEKGPRTPAIHLNDLFPAEYYFTGEMEAAGADPMPSGKFRALRIDAGVVTPGAKCSATAQLLDETDRRIASYGGSDAKDLPSGKSVVTFEFEGAKIGRRATDGPLIVSSLTLFCGSKRTVTRDELRRELSIPLNLTIRRPMSSSS